MSTDEHVMQTIADTLGVDRADITPDTKADDVVTWDSMGKMSILFALTDEFGVALGPDDTDNLDSVRGILNLVRDTNENA